MDLTNLERAVLRAIAQGDPERSTMERQVEAAEADTREYTGMGFYTKLRIPEDAPLLRPDRWKIEDMGHGFARHPLLDGGACFILWIRNSRIVTLEGYSLDDGWPKDESAFEVAV